VKDRPDADVVATPRSVTQGLFDEFGAHVVGECPPEDPSTVLVANRAQVGLAGADGHVGDIARPHEVERSLVEATLHLVRGVTRVRVGLGRHLEQTRTDPL
jgi:hypothetical protein